jgi:septal ring factor EnvC (AmiA/AmiB activator)
MTGRNLVVTIIVALLSGGITPFLVALLKRKPEVKQLDAQTTNITIQGAETTVTVLMKSLERAEAREAALEAKLADRETKLDDLERRFEEMSVKFREAQRELEDARRQLEAMRQG